MKPLLTSPPAIVTSRRRALQRLAFSAAAFSATPGLFAEQMAKTPQQTEGPFYPDNLPLDTDNDLLIINEKLTPAVGEVTHLSGQVFHENGSPARNVVVEIWQVDNKGVYLHSGDRKNGKPDPNFQGYGRFLTDQQGRYYFRTIKPSDYGPRTAHIHYAVNRGDQRILTTQCYVDGNAKNKTDRILNNTKAGESLIVPFQKIPDSPSGELSAKFNLVIGKTPEDRDADQGRRRRPQRR